MRFEHIQRKPQNGLNPEKVSELAFCYRLLNRSDDFLNDSSENFPTFFDIESFYWKFKNLKQSVLKQFKSF